MSSRTSPPASRTRCTASATSSRGASSSTNRSPSPSSSSAPSPRTASVMRKPSSAGSSCTSAVGWNCMNSRSASSAPAAAASVSPAPIAPRGFVVRSHSAASPPVAITVPRASTGVSAPPGRSATTPTQRPSEHHSELAVERSSTSIRSCVATSADRSRVIRRPVALPPACTTRRLEWPPSRPSSSAPAWSVSKCTPSASRSRTAAGECSHSTRAALSRLAPRPALQGVLEVALDRVVGRERGCDPALGPVARRLRQRRARHEHDARALARRGERRVEPRRAGATTATSARSGSVVGSPATLRLPYRDRGPSLLQARLVARARHGRPPRGPGPDSRRSSASWSAATGSATSGARRPRST